MRNKSSVSDRIIGEAIEAYLGREGLVVIDRGCAGLIDYVCRERETGYLVFIAVTAGNGTNDSQEDFDRWKVEREMLCYITQADYAVDDTRVRFDTIHIFACGSKGMLRHHRAATE